MIGTFETLLADTVTHQQGQYHNTPPYSAPLHLHHFTPSQYTTSQQQQQQYTTPQEQYNMPQNSSSASQDGPVCLVSKGVPRFVGNIPDVCSQEESAHDGYHGNNVVHGYHGNNRPGYHGNNVHGYHGNNIPPYQSTSPIYPAQQTAASPWQIPPDQELNTHVSQHQQYMPHHHQHMSQQLPSHQVCITGCYQ